MITADEKLWPWQSSDVTKEGMLTTNFVFEQISSGMRNIDLRLDN